MLVVGGGRCVGGVMDELGTGTGLRGKRQSLSRNHLHLPKLNKGNYQLLGITLVGSLAQIVEDLETQEAEENGYRIR